MVAADVPIESHAPIRVLVANTVGVLPEIVVKLIDQQPDMILAGQVQEAIDLLLAVEGIDVLVLSAEHLAPLPGICSHLLAEFPDLRILVVATDDDVAMLYWLGLRQQFLWPLLPTVLVDGIRMAYRINATA